MYRFLEKNHRCCSLPESRVVPVEQGKSSRNKERKRRIEDDIVSNVVTAVTIVTLTLLLQLTFHPIIRDRQQQSWSWYKYCSHCGLSNLGAFFLHSQFERK